MIDRRAEQPTLGEKMNAWTGAFVAVAVIALNAVITVFIFTREIPQSNQTIVGQLLGSWLTSMGVIVGYFFVASISSRKKDEIIATQAKTAQVAGAALPTADGSAIVLKPGESATATATEGGTEIKPDP
jgi:hypothetical protein